VRNRETERERKKETEKERKREKTEREYFKTEEKSKSFFFPVFFFYHQFDH